jgi:hypothetical protein
MVEGEKTNKNNVNFCFGNEYARKLMDDYKVSQGINRCLGMIHWINYWDIMMDASTEGMNGCIDSGNEWMHRLGE